MDRKTCSPVRDVNEQIFTKFIHVRQTIRKNSYTKFYEDRTNISCTRTGAQKRRHPHIRFSSYTSSSRDKNQEPCLRQEKLPHRQYKPGRCHPITHVFISRILQCVRALAFVYVKLPCQFSFLWEFAKLRKATIYFPIYVCMSVRPSV
jgi:hypothetical protein